MPTLSLPRPFSALLARAPEPRPSLRVPDAQARRAAYVVSRAEAAECTCPSFCERDHGNE